MPKQYKNTQGRLVVTEDTANVTDYTRAQIENMVSIYQTKLLEAQGLLTKCDELGVLT